MNYGTPEFHDEIPKNFRLSDEVAFSFNRRPRVAFISTPIVRRLWRFLRCEGPRSPNHRRLWGRR